MAALQLRRTMAKTKYSDELAEELAQHIEALVPITFAPPLVGITYSTFDRWMNGEGGIPKSKVSEFCERIERARAVAVKGRVANITRAGDTGDWKADAWYLEHVYPNDFMSKQRNEHTGADGAPVTVSVVRIHEPDGS
jgi:hypothetical protein